MMNPEHRVRRTQQPQVRVSAAGLRIITKSSIDPDPYAARNGL
jgi:hypothetical protein